MTTNKQPKNTPITITDFVSDDDSTLAVQESWLSAAIAASYQQPARPSDTSVFERLSVPSLNLSKAILVAAADLDKRWRSDCIAVANYLTRRLGYIAITEEAAVIASQS